MIASLATLLPTPLHPAVVHLPIGLAVLLPLIAVGALVAGRRGGRPHRSWAVALAFFAALTLSAWGALQTGEREADAVERVVPEVALESHEEAADQFLWLAVGVLAVASFGMLNWRGASAARHAAVAGSFAVLAMGYRVGHSGGTLVYAHGAATAYTSGASTPSQQQSHETDEDDR